MKAARRFKQRLMRKRPELMQSIFGNTSRFVQPPGMLRGDHEASVQRSKSSDVDNRRPVEGALTAEGIHRDIDVSRNLDKLPYDVDSMTISADSSTKASAASTHSSLTPEPRSKGTPLHTQSLPPDLTPGKGQAHDPLEDTLFLHIGNGTVDGNAPTYNADVVIVSESPGAVSINVYEQAYQEEIDRILREREGTKQSRRPTLFLTRRVEDVERIRDNVHLCAMEHKETVKSAGEYGRAGLLGAGEYGRETVKTASDYGRAGLAGLVAKAKSKAKDVVDEYDRRKQGESGT